MESPLQFLVGKANTPEAAIAQLRAATDEELTAFLTQVNALETKTTADVAAVLQTGLADIKTMLQPFADTAGKFAALADKINSILK